MYLYALAVNCNICLSVCPCNWPSVYLSISLLAYMSVYLSVYMTVYLSICIYVCLSVSLANFIGLSVSLNRSARERSLKCLSLLFPLVSLSLSLCLSFPALTFLLVRISMWLRLMLYV